MLFQATITIPTTATKASPTVATMKIARGIITKFMVRPRPGHAATAHLVILYHEHQIAPSTETMTLKGDADPIDWEDYYESYQPPYELKLKGWADGSTFDHTFDVFVAVLPRRAILALAVVDSFKELFGLISPRRILQGKD